MMRFLATLAFGLVAVGSGTARADHYIHTSSAQVDHAWGIGLRTDSQGLSNDSDDDTLHLDGGGLHVRWRYAPHWSVELSTEGLHADLYEGAYHRELQNSNVTFGYHFTPYHRWDWAILLGIGGTDDQVEYRRVDGTMGTESAEEINVMFGAGVEYRWTHLGLGADFRAVGYARTDEEDPPEDYDPAYDFRAIPSGQQAGQFNLHLTYYF